MDASRRIGYALRSVSHMVKLSIDQAIAQHKTHGVTGMQGWIIGYLYRHTEQGASFQHDLELEFNIRPSTATGLLQRMERDGLLIREPVAYDARRKKIILTSKAVDIHKNVMRAIDGVEQSITNGLSADEIETLFQIMEKIKRNLAPPANTPEPK